MKQATTVILEEQPFFVGSFLTDHCDIEIHLHSAFEIFMATTNNIRYYIEGQTYDLQAGDLIITNMSEIHRPTITDQQLYGRKFILFNPSVFTPYLENAYPLFSIFNKRKKGQFNHLRPTNQDRKEIEVLFDDMVLYLSKKDPKSILQACVLALELFLKTDTVYNYTYPNNDACNNDSKVDERVQAILSDLNQNYQQPYCLDDLAKRHYMDKYYMCHLFKKETGFSVLEYIQSRRILYAKSLINSSSFTLSEISQQCGFADYSNFYKTFKKLVALSPREFQSRYADTQE